MAYTTWKGSVKQYKAIHWEIGKLFGKPNQCEDCGKTTGKFEWANLSGKYTLDRTDWKRLCAKCHKALDAASYVGRRFTGKTHKPESRSKTAESMRQFWKEHPEIMEVAHAKASRAKRENNIRRRMEVKYDN